MSTSADAAIFPAPAFLGVEESFCGRRWRPRLDEAGRRAALTMAQREGLSPLLADVLAARGVRPEQAAEFIAPTLRSLLPEPYRFTDMEPAANRIAAAIQAGEHVAIFADYDVDGATSGAILASLFEAAGTPHTLYVPDRIFEGYGPNVEAIRRLAEAGAQLLVTVDCGSTSHEALAEARRLGMGTVVLDHHQLGETLPEVDALVNPNRADCLSACGHLAACGVVFITVVAVNRLLRQSGFWTADRPEPDILALADLVALGTVADVVPLAGVNRAFVKRGLQVMAERRRLGLRALADVARLNGPPSPYHLGFLIGPRINAGGRIGRADLGARLLLERDEVRAGAMAAELDRLNSERQAIEQATLAEAENQFSGDAPVALVAGEGWHPGIVGLVAARMKERTGRPAFAIAVAEDGTGTGSGRSLPGVDLGQAVRQAVSEGLLAKGGGHAMAAGVTVPPGGLGAFRAFLHERLAEDIERARRSDSLKVDGVLTAGALNTDLCREIAQAGPFGSGNPEPVFALADHVLIAAEPVGSAHLRLRLRARDGSSADAIAFRALGQPLGDALQARRGQGVHVAGAVSIDNWGGREKVSFRVFDAASANP